MSEPIINALVLIAVIALLLGSLLVSPQFRAYVAQNRADKKRAKAHEGRLRCDDKDCDFLATYLTPNGYFCDWHWEPMSKREIPGGGFVTWHHVLNHAVHRS